MVFDLLSRCDVSDKLAIIFAARYWWLKLSAISEIRDWAELERFSRSKKSPIGYEVS